MSPRGALTSDRADNRLPWVDVLRGLSILAVVLLHINIRIPFAQSALGSHLPREVSRVLFGSGFFGVRVFFVISGFLITTTILRRWHALADVGRHALLPFARCTDCALSPGPSGVALRAAFWQCPGFCCDKDHAWTGAGCGSHVPNQSTGDFGRISASGVGRSLVVIHRGSVLPRVPVVARFLRAPWLVVGAAVVLIVLGPLARTVWPGSDT